MLLNVEWVGLCLFKLRTYSNLLEPTRSWEEAHHEIPYESAWVERGFRRVPGHSGCLLIGPIYERLQGSYCSRGCGLGVGAARVSDLQRCVHVGQCARATCIARWVLVYWVHATGASRGVLAAAGA